MKLLKSVSNEQEEFDVPPPKVVKFGYANMGLQIKLDAAIRRMGARYPGHPDFPKVKKGDYTA